MPAKWEVPMRHLLVAILFVGCGVKSDRPGPTDEVAGAARALRRNLESGAEQALFEGGFANDVK